MGLGLSAYWICKNILYKGYRGFIKYIKTWGNSAKFLSSDSPKDEQGKKLKYTAVIYGASTKVGRAYAHYLIRFGFNLILVERDRNQLDDIEADLKKDSIYDVKITKIVLDKFDQDTLNKQLVNPLKEHKNSPVKLFINCKNSRRKIQTENS